jgi:hypothetical protein
MMTLQQKAINVIERLPEDKIIQVIKFAEFLYLDVKPQTQSDISKDMNDEDYIRKPGILRRKMVMSEDFDDTPDCFKEYM